MRLSIHLIGGLCLALPLIGCGCADSDAGPADEAESGANQTEPTAPAVPVSEAPVSEAPAPPASNEKAPDPKDALARSEQRWEMIQAEDWIQAYDFLTPARKKQEKLGNFLAGKADHEYRNPSKPHLLGTEGEQAYLEVSVLWTPHHDILGTADNAPEDFTQQLEMIETWQWIDEEWCWVGVARQNEFLDEHPKFKK